MKPLFGVLATTLFALTLSSCMQDFGTGPMSATDAGLKSSARPDETPGQAIVFTAAGDITGSVDGFRNALGGLNPNVPGSLGAGRREINWDAVPALFTNRDDFPSDFFNQPAVGRARGLVSTTAGTGFRVSDDNFGDLNSDFRNEFVFFSPIRTFAPVGSNVMTATFFVPGSNVPAVSSGFGVVFSDVDRLGSSFIQLFAADGRNLGRFLAPVAPSGVSFVGVTFPRAVIARVEITSGQAPVSPTAIDVSDRGGLPPARDLVIMDDFIYGEPLGTSTGSAVAVR